MTLQDYYDTGISLANQANNEGEIGLKYQGKVDSLEQSAVKDGYEQRATEIFDSVLDSYPV